ncbi:MAG: hypothetical protein IJA55_10735, partial [Clostridia bacterium]|nr:hypothetical protein [Clostridia bacterium]
AAVAPTCTETGLTEGKHCSVCGEVLIAQEVVDALGHDYEAVVTEPDCINGGYTTYTCSVCGDSYVADETDALGHTEAEAVIENNVDPDCENTGSYDLVVYCSVCNEELSRETKTVDALGHKYDAVVTAPTCKEKGYTTYTCSNCGDSYVTDYVDATNHVGEETYILIVEGKPMTETTDGTYYEVTYCCGCDTELSRKEYALHAVALNVDSGKLYTTLEAALEEAASGSTVKLLDNVEVENAVALTLGYLDLNGHVLEVYTISTGMSTHIIDSSEGNKGHLVIGAENQTINPSNCDLPIYVSYTDEDGSVKDGYRFFDSIKLQQLTPKFTVDEKTGSRFVSVTFRHIIDDAATTKELFGDGAADNRLKFGIKFKVTKADGTESEQMYWLCSDSLVASAYTNGNAIMVTITGIQTYDTITIGSVIISEDLGVEITTSEKNGTTYSTIGTYDIVTGTEIKA